MKQNRNRIVFDLVILCAMIYPIDNLIYQACIQFWLIEWHRIISGIMRYVSYQGANSATRGIYCIRMQIRETLQGNSACRINCAVA